MYCLKDGQPAFEIVDGPQAGQKFMPGQQYDYAQLPAAEKKKFRTVRDKTVAAPRAAAKEETQ